MTLVDHFLAGSRHGLEGHRLAHWALAKAGCSEPWVMGSASALVTHSEPYSPDRPPVPGDVLLCWRHPHGADAEVGCVVSLTPGGALVLGSSRAIWPLDLPDIKGVLRAAGLRGIVSHENA